MSRSVEIEYLGDFTCPFCYLAKAVLKKAIDTLPDIEVSFRYVPFEGSPITEPKVDTYHDPVRAKRYQEKIYPRMEELGLEGKIPPKVVPRPYTRNAYQGLYFAQDKGKADAYVEEVMRAYYVREQDIEQLEVLAEAAERIGLDGEALKKAIQEEQYLQTLINDEKKLLAEREIKGLPTLTLNGQTTLIGSGYSVEEIAEAIRKAAEGTTNISEQEAGAYCGINGCNN